MNGNSYFRTSIHYILLTHNNQAFFEKSTEVAKKHNKVKEYKFYTNKLYLSGLIFSFSIILNQGDRKQGIYQRLIKTKRE